VQELVCARELIIWCGSQTLNEEFPVLEAAARLFMMWNCTCKTQLATTVLEDKEAEGIGRSKLMCAGRLGSFKSLKDNGLSGILWLLLLTRCFHATDSRDKIFALVGLASDIGEEFVDYSKSYDDVVRELSRMLLDGRIETTSGSVFDLWSCITRDEDDDLAGSSWVVDWLKLRDSLYTPLMSQYGSDLPTIHRKPEIHFLEVDKAEVHGPCIHVLSLD
jgi:starch phosphorylase